MKRICLVLGALLLFNPNYSQSNDTLFVKSGDVKIHTVISKPITFDKKVLAIIVPGSGPTDLNGNQPKVMNNSMLLLSNELVKNGIHTVRFDKRGIAKSSDSSIVESELSIDRFVEDIDCLFDKFESMGYDEIYLIGHSEGSLMSMIISSKREVKGLISLCGAGSSADILLKSQLIKQLPKELYDQTDLIIDSLKNGNPVKRFPPQLNALFRATIQPYLISWFKYNPCEILKQIKTQVLIVHGTKDIQIGLNESQLLYEASPLSKYVIIQDMNHIFKTISGDMNENLKSYINPDLPINSELVNCIVSFIKSNQ